MAELKTKKNQDDPRKFLGTVENEKRREDSLAVLDLMERVTGAPPVMWGSSIIGFGTCTIHYADGKTGDWMATGFSPRKQALTLYIMSGFDEYSDLLAKLGKYTTGKACLYVKKLEDIDLAILEELIRKSVDAVQKGRM